MSHNFMDKLHIAYLQDRGTMLQREECITGQVFVRDTGDVDKETGRHIHILTAILAFPANAMFEPEHTYTVVGHDNVLELIRETGKVPELPKGTLTLDQVLLAPIWKV
jgi:hypothetical protein